MDDAMTDVAPPFSVCVFCGASGAVSSAHSAAAAAMGRAIANAGLGLVYGGASVGMMGVLADAALAAGAKVTGVMPSMLVDREIAHRSLSELVVVESMHARKAEMARRSHAFVALPGGFGTLDELFEITTWLQLGLHSSPIGLLDVDGYFQPLLDFVAHACQIGFIKPAHRELWRVSCDATDLLSALTDAARHPARSVRRD
jgi:uncharacterized protein (TIGR00730 family)